MAKLPGMVPLFLIGLLLMLFAGLPQNVYADNGFQITLPLIVSILVILLISAGTAYLTFKIGFLSIRLIVVGIAMVFIGTILLLYGDYNGGYIYALLGAFVVFLGVVLLLVGDWKAGAFNKRIAKWLEDVSASK